MKRAAFVLMFALLWGCSSMPSRFVALSEAGGPDVPVGEMLKAVANGPVIFVGESHTNSRDHYVQLEVIKYLYKHGKNPVIALEMFPEGMQLELNRWVDGKMDKGTFRQMYHSVWNIPFDNYEKIFDYAREKKIPLVGVNVRKELIKEVSERGVGVVSRESLERIKFTPCSEEPEYARTFGLGKDRVEHESRMIYLCDAQRFRDAVMAYYISQLARMDKGTVVVLLGAAHAAKASVPAMLERQMNVKYSVLMPESFRDMTGKEPDARLADYLWY
ncbi:MAG: ChaN family lipoprotein [Nitrospiraceae bacterium]|nr:ChaN family lipoprotein [Nitrospiraceae bacterium]